MGMEVAPTASASQGALSIADAVPVSRFSVQGVVLGLAVAVLLFLVGYPLLWLVLGALGMPQSIGLEHLQRAFTRPQNYAALVNTLQLALGTGLMSVALGVPLAWATARSDMPLRQIVHALVALSYITPPYLTALAYIILLGPDAGQFNRVLRTLFGFESGPINIFSMPGVIFVIGIHVFAFTYFLTYSALKSVDASLEESAQILGAKRWQTALRINLPLVAPAITGGALLAAIDSLALFGPQAIIGTPAQIVFLPTRIYATIGSYPPRWGEASALSLVLVALTVAGLALQRGYLERRSYITVGGRGVRTKNVELGAWRWPLLGFCLTVVFFSAAAPIGVLALTAFSKSWTEPLSLANFTLAHFGAALFHDQVSVRGILNSFRLATAAAVLAVLIGAAVAYLDLRTTVRGRRLLDYLAILPLGLPGTVMAVGILLAFIRLPVPIYGTIWILLAAYVARFIPLATRSANATFRQIDPSLEEAGRVTGASWWHAIRRILFPLSRPGLLVAFLLVFIPAFSELSATILLYTGGTETIAIAIYRLNDLGQLEVVSALAVFTIAVVLTLAGLVNVLSGSSWTSGETPPVRG
jgi:iron(III) transport system permease protein